MNNENSIIEHCSVILLAGGTSRRLGQAKQLLKYKGKTLIEHAVEAVLETGIQSLVVVLGANSEEMEKVLNKYEVKLVKNSGWQEGIASSIRCGLEYILKVNPSTDGVLFLVSDQPFVDSALLKNLLQTQQKTGKPVVCCYYGDTAGVPALFHKSIFPDLLALQGDTGARKIIMKHEDELETVPFPSGSIDIDTKEDYDNLINKN